MKFNNCFPSHEQQPAGSAGPTAGRLRRAPEDTVPASGPENAGRTRGQRRALAEAHGYSSGLRDALLLRGLDLRRGLL